MIINVKFGIEEKIFMDSSIDVIILKIHIFQRNSTFFNIFEIYVLSFFQICEIEELSLIMPYSFFKFFKNVDLFKVITRFLTE